MKQINISKCINQEKYRPSINLFLKTLHKYSIEENIEFLYCYVKNLLEYFDTAYVADSSKLIIDLPIQMSDVGDEVFDCIYAVENELFGKEGYNKHFDLGKLHYSGENTYTPDENLTCEVVLKDGRARECAQYIGSYSSRLHIHWEVDFKEIS